MKKNSTNELQFVNEFRKRIFQDQIMLTYMGEISQEIIVALLNMTEKKLSERKEDRAIKSKIFNVMVECLQNITCHSEKNKYARSSMFTISRCSAGYVIYSGSALDRPKAAELGEKLTRINEMTVAELREFYLHWLQTGEIEEQQGAGLGLIDIARKTGNTLEFDFEEIDSDYIYFSLKTMVKPKNIRTRS